MYGSKRTGTTVEIRAGFTGETAIVHVISRDPIASFEKSEGLSVSVAGHNVTYDPGRHTVTVDGILVAAAR